MKENSPINPENNELKKDDNLQNNKQNKNIEETKLNNEEDANEEEKVPISERIEDAMDDIVHGTYDAIYGSTDDYSHDIPAMYEKDSGVKVINKVQTRRNIINRVLGKKGKLIFLGVMLVALVIGLIVSFIG